MQFVIVVFPDHTHWKRDIWFALILFFLVLLYLFLAVLWFSLCVVIMVFPAYTHLPFERNHYKWCKISDTRFFISVFIIHVAPCLTMKIIRPVLYHLGTKGTKCFGCWTFSDDGHFVAMSLLRLLQLGIVNSWLSDTMFYGTYIWSHLINVPYHWTPFSALHQGFSEYNCITLQSLLWQLFPVAFKKLIQFLECLWNHKYFGSLAK